MIEKNWKSLINTDIIEIKNNNNNPFSATVNVEPLERGFGVTIGNALRRVLLSSLQGTAITGMQVQGVLHEFSTIPGVIEDVTDIVLNVKGIILKMEVEGPKRLRLNVKGPANITAEMIELTSGIEEGEEDGNDVDWTNHSFDMSDFSVDVAEYDDSDDVVVSHSVGS